MPDFRPGQIVRTPFPYTDRDTRQHRPALVVSNGSVGRPNLLWVVMITSADNPDWPEDVALPRAAADYGLPAPSKVRPVKIATVDSERVEIVGAISSEELTEVDARIADVLSR